MTKQFFSYLLPALLILIVSGCAKKQPKQRIKPLDSYGYKESSEGVTLQVSYISPKRFKKIYPRGLGKYVLLDQSESYKGKKMRAIKRRVRMLQGTIINNTKKTIFISRRDVSLPIIPPSKAYQQNTFLRNFSFVWLGIWGPVAILCTYLSCALLPAVMLPALLVGGAFTIPSATVGTIEHLKQLERRDFARATMLSNETHCIKPAESLSWLMMIPYRQYNPEFTITCIDEEDVKQRFEVSMAEIANKPNFW